MRRTASSGGLCRLPSNEPDEVVSRGQVTSQLGPRQTHGSASDERPPTVFTQPKISSTRLRKLWPLHSQGDMSCVDRSHCVDHLCSGPRGGCHTALARGHRPVMIHRDTLHLRVLHGCVSRALCGCFSVSSAPVQTGGANSRSAHRIRRIRDVPRIVRFISPIAGRESIRCSYAHGDPCGGFWRSRPSHTPQLCPCLTIHHRARLWRTGWTFSSVRSTDAEAANTVSKK